jgi:dsRNA-specific ribonuclease
VTLMIHEKYPQLAVAQRSLIQLALVEKKTLSRLAAAYKMPDRILAAGAEADLLHKDANVQTSVFEAYLGAVHEEAGEAELCQFMRDVFEPLLPPLVRTCRSLSGTANDTQEQAAEPIYMDALQHWADENGVKLVMEYKRLKIDLGHGPESMVKCTITFLHEGEGRHYLLNGVAGSEAEAREECVPSLPPCSYR